MASTGIWEPHGHSMGKTPTLIGTFPPFSALVADVTAFRKPFGKCASFVDVRDQQFVDMLVLFRCMFRIGCCSCRIVSRGLVLVGVKSRCQCHQRRTAKSGWYIATPKNHALLRKLIQIRSLDRWMPHETVVRVALVIREDQDNVGRSGISCRATGYQGQRYSDHKTLDVP